MALALGGAVVAAVLLLQGPRLGALVTKTVAGLGLPGKIQVGAIRWPARALWDVITDAPTPFVLEDVTIDDPDGTRVLSVSRLDARLPLRSALGGKVRLSDVVIGPGSHWRFGDTKDGTAIGFLAALVPPAPPPGKAPTSRPSPEASPPTDAGLVLEIVNARLEGLTAEFDFPGAWGLRLEDVHGDASLTIDGSFVGWDAQRLHARKGGYLRILENETLPFDDVKVARVATTRAWPNDIFLEVEAGRTGRSVLSGKGYFTHIYDDAPPGIDLRAAFDKAGDALSAVVKGHAIEGLSVSGPEATVKLALTEPFTRIAIAGEVAGLNVGYRGARAENLGLSLRFSAGEPLSVKVEDLHFKVPEGGRVNLDAAVVGNKATADLRLSHVTNDALVPPALAAEVGARVNGRVKAAFDLARSEGRVHLQNLSIQRHQAAGLPRSATLDGVVLASPERIETQDLRIAVPGASAELRGRVQLAKKLLGVTVSAVARDLPEALAFLNPPPQLPRSAELELRLDGSFDNPRIAGHATAQGVALNETTAVPNLKAKFRLEDGVARVDALEGGLFGGHVALSGEARLFQGSLENLLKAPVLDVKVQGRRLDLGTLLASPELAGQFSFEGWAKGPADALTGSLKLPPDTTLEILGQTWRIRGFEVMARPRELVLRSTRLEREVGGAVVLEGRLSLDKGQAMAWSVHVIGFPLANLPGVQSAPALEGKVDAKLEIKGSPAAPQVAGVVDLTRGVLDGRALGDAHLTLAPRPGGGTRVSGRLFDRFDLQAEVALARAGPHVTAQLAFQDLLVHELAPEVAERVGFNARVSGQVDIALLPGRPLALDARLDQLQMVSRPRNDLLGGGSPLEVRNDGPVVARVRGDRIELAPTRLETTGGVLELSGRLEGERLDQVVVRGQLDLALLAPALQPYVQRSEGNITLALRATGALNRPEVQGSVTVALPVEIRLPTLDLPVRVPQGRVTMGRRDIELHKLVVEVGDSHLLLQGRASFDERYQVTRYGIGADGTLDAKILPLLAPKAITEAEGQLKLRGRIGGTPTEPDFDAKVETNGVSLRMRDLGRLIRVESAELSVNPREARIDKLRATIDDQGVITIGGAGAEPGRLVFQQLFPEPVVKYARLPVRGERLAYRSPGVFALDDIGFDLELEGDLRQQLTLRGDVRVVTGRFSQDVAIRDLAISSRLRGEAYGRQAPNPLLDDMRLDLRVRTIGDTFLIQNNVAPEIYAVVDLHVGGTAGDPRLDGAILPTDGRFKVPGTGTRGYFDLVPVANSIVFVGTKTLGENTPELNLEAESLVTDSDGNEHNVRMRIRGPVSQAEITFSTTDTGLNQNETLLLLLSGRSSTSSVRFGTSSPNLGRNLDTGFQMAGNVTRDLVDNLLQPYISDTLSLLTGDKLQLRPTIGPDGVEVRVFGRAGRYLRLQLNYLQGFQGQRQARGEGRVWLADFVSFRTFAEYLVLPQQGITETNRSLNMEVFVEWPVRFDLP